MAIPYLYSTLKQRWPKLVKQSKGAQCDALYLDLNSILHTCLKETSTITEFYRMVIACIRKLVAALRPKKLLYIALDGTPPLAKLKGQAVRRSTSLSRSPMDSNALTPGTELMHLLSEHIRSSAKGLFGLKKSPFQIIISDSTVPGEGEFKIIRHIRNQVEDNLKDEIMIYGFDGDLIILGLSLKHNGISLARQRNTRGSFLDNKIYEIFNINELAKSLLKIYPTPLDASLPKQNVIRDIVLLLSLLGNDFLPSPEGMKVDNSTLNSLLDKLCLFHTENNRFITDTEGQVNKSNFDIFVRSLKDIDMDYFNFQSRLSQSAIDSKVLELQLSGLSLSDKKSRIRDATSQVESELFEKWKQKRYAWVFRSVNTALYRYYEGVCWLLKYYLTDNPPGAFMYEYSHAPFISDLALITEEPRPLEDVQLNVLHQLALVTPKRSKALLPVCYRDSDTYNDFSTLLLNSKIVTSQDIQFWVNFFEKTLDPALTESERERATSGKEITIDPNV